MKDYRSAITAFAVTVGIIGVAHAVTDTTFHYSTPKTGWLAISPGDLVPGTNNDGYLISGATAKLTTGASCFVTGVHLPQGADIQGVAIWYSSDNSGDIQVSLVRRRLTDGLPDTLALLHPHDDSLARKVASTTVSATLGVVNNGGYSYAFSFCPQTAGSAFHAGRITYSYTNAGD